MDKVAKINNQREIAAAIERGMLYNQVQLSQAELRFVRKIKFSDRPVPPYAFSALLTLASRMEALHA